MKRITVRFAAIYQLLSALGLAATCAFQWVLFDGLSLAVYVLLFVINLATGIGILKQLRWASYLGMLNLALQIPTVNSQTFTYSYVGVGDLFFKAQIDPTSSTYLFGPWIQFSPGTFRIYLDIQFQGLEVYIGLLAMIMTAVMAKECTRREAV